MFANALWSAASRARVQTIASHRVLLWPGVAAFRVSTVSPLYGVCCTVRVVLPQVGIGSGLTVCCKWACLSFDLMCDHSEKSVCVFFLTAAVTSANCTTDCSGYFRVCRTLDVSSCFTIDRSNFFCEQEGAMSRATGIKHYYSLTR